MTTPHSPSFFDLKPFLLAVVRDAAAYDNTQKLSGSFSSSTCALSRFNLSAAFKICGFQSVPLFRRLVVRSASIALPPGGHVENSDIINIASAFAVSVDDLIIHLDHKNTPRTSWEEVSKLSGFLRFKKEHTNPQTICEWEAPMDNSFMCPNGNSPASVSALVDIITRQQALFSAAAISAAIPTQKRAKPLKKM